MLLLTLAAAAALAARSSANDQITYKLGAVLREREDAHIAAALEFSVMMLNDNEKITPKVHLQVEYIKPDDHYGAIRKACSLVEDHSVVAVVGPSDTYLNDQLSRTLGQLDLPLITVNDDFRLDNHEGRLQLFPRLQLFDAVSDMFKYWKWQRITIVYEDDARIRRIKSILESDQFKNTRFILIRVHDKDYMRAAKEVKESEECRYLHKKDCSEFNRVLVDLSPEQSFNFLLAALRMGLIELKHWFVLTSMELSSLDMDLFRHNHARFISPNPVDLSFEKAHGNRTTFSMKGFQQYVLNAWNQKTNGNLDFKLMEAVFAFDAVRAFAKAQKHIPQVPYSAPIATCRRPARPARPFPHGKMVGLLMKNVNEKGLSGDLRRLTGDEKASNFTMRIQLLGYSGDLEDIGFWNSNVSVDIKPDGRKQLMKNKQVSDELKPHFRVTTIMERPYVMHKTNHYELSHNNKYEGFCIDLLTELSKDLGFTFSIHTVKDGSYGNAKNGTWDGMIGEILRGEAEMAVAPLTVNFKRAEVVDFTKPFLSLGISILFKVPSDQQPDLFSFLNPLSWQIWLCILGAIGGVTLGMFAVARITPYEWNLNFSCCTAHQPHPAASFTPADAPVELSNNYSFFNTLWYVTSTMLKGGCDFGPRAVSTRLLGESNMALKYDAKHDPQPLPTSPVDPTSRRLPCCLCGVLLFALMVYCGIFYYFFSSSSSYPITTYAPRAPIAPMAPAASASMEPPRPTGTAEQNCHPSNIPEAFFNDTGRFPEEELHFLPCVNAFRFNVDLMTQVKNRMEDGVWDRENPTKLPVGGEDAYKKYSIEYALALARVTNGDYEELDGYWGKEYNKPHFAEGEWLVLWQEEVAGLSQTDWIRHNVCMKCIAPLVEKYVMQLYDLTAPRQLKWLLRRLEIKLAER
ncbi:glr-5 [Pristionchus pacificus]|uniref:Glr-5 n=2 Tax=Pristionchus pacificus TaxID=54126 RepID=A0A2A6BSL0_PRIPA|nr:glr-5 [Pristionchus pacificus]|eukprot:PDM68952.1 glr-5 [Pristionchus pacificus]